MKGLNLTHHQLVHNSGGDLWDYLFENQPLKHLGVKEEDDEKDEWYEQAIDWLTEQLFDGEVFEVMEEDDRYAYTSLGRHANLKKREFKALQLQGNSICGNMKGGAISFSKLVKNRWNIDLDYKTLPYEIQKDIRIGNAAKGIKEWIKDNDFG